MASRAYHTKREHTYCWCLLQNNSNTVPLKGSAGCNRMLGLLHAGKIAFYTNVSIHALKVRYRGQRDGFNTCLSAQVFSARERRWRPLALHLPQREEGRSGCNATGEKVQTFLPVILTSQPISSKLQRLKCPGLERSFEKDDLSVNT